MTPGAEAPTSRGSALLCSSQGHYFLCLPLAGLVHPVRSQCARCQTHHPPPTDAGLEGLCRCQYDIAGGIVDPGNAEAQDRQLQAYFDFVSGRDGQE